MYHGLVVLNEVTADGFTLGKITDFEAEPCEEGDAFVRTVWKQSRVGLGNPRPAYFREVTPVETSRWGVSGVGFRLPMNSRENARRNLENRFFGI